MIVKYQTFRKQKLTVWLICWFGKINDVPPFVCEWRLLNVVVVCPGINNVVVAVGILGIVNSVLSGIGRLLIGLLVNGSRSYNLKTQSISFL